MASMVGRMGFGTGCSNLTGASQLERVKERAKPVLQLRGSIQTTSTMYGSSRQIRTTFKPQANSSDYVLETPQRQRKLTVINIHSLMPRMMSPASNPPTLDMSRLLLCSDGLLGIGASPKLLPPILDRSQQNRRH